MATIDDFQDKLLAMKAAGKTHPEMLSWLGTKDVDTSLATIGRRFKDWGIRKKTSFLTTDELIAKVKDLYTHKWHLSDEQVARRCTDEAGNRPTVNQVRDIRLKHRFVRRVTGQSECPIRGRMIIYISICLYKTILRLHFAQIHVFPWVLIISSKIW